MSIKCPSDPSEPSCLSCSFCTMNHPGRKVPESPCSPWMSGPFRPLDPRNPPEYRWEKNPFRLYGILRAITPKDLWKRWRKASNPYALGGYKKETHERVRLKDCPKPKSRRISTTRPPWHWLRRGLERQMELETPSPRITTIAHHGPRSLLHPFFPEMEGAPEGFQLSMSPERIEEIVRDQRAKRLAGTSNLSLGGHGSDRRIADLEELKSPLGEAESMEEVEPLRAMSLKEVTNIPFLKGYTALREKEEKDDGQED